MTDADKLAQVLGDVWDDGNASGLDGWVGPGRGTLPVDDQAVWNRDRAIRKYTAVVLAHLTAEGWAQGHEEWAYGATGGYDGTYVRPTSNEAEARDRAQINDCGVFRRYLTEHKGTP